MSDKPISPLRQRLISLADGLARPLLTSASAVRTLQSRKAEKQIGRAGNEGRRPERSGVASRTGYS